MISSRRVGMLMPIAETLSYPARDRADDRSVTVVHAKRPVRAADTADSRYGETVTAGTPRRDFLHVRDEPFLCGEESHAGTRLARRLRVSGSGE